MSTTIPQGGYGIASVSTDSYRDAELFAGDTPAVVTQEARIGPVLGANSAGEVLRAWAPVHVTSDGLVYRTSLSDSSGRPANAITASAVIVETSARVLLYRAGMFNPEALAFGEVDYGSDDTYGKYPPATRDVMDHYLFGRTTDHQIYLKRPYYGRV